MGYLIFADVSVDIDMDIAREKEIRFVPMEYVLGDDTFMCNQPESNEVMHNFYEKLRGKVETHTSQITPNNYFELFEPYLKDGKKKIYISLSNRLNNTYE